MITSVACSPHDDRSFHFVFDTGENYPGWTLSARVDSISTFSAWALTRAELEALRDGAIHALANYDLPGDPAGSSETSKPAA